MTQLRFPDLVPPHVHHRDSLGDLPSGHFANQFRGPPRRRVHPLRIDPSLESVRRFRLHPQPPGRLPYAQGIEVRALQQHHLRPHSHLGIKPSHNSRHRHGALPVRDHQHVAVQLSFHVIDGDKSLALPRSTHDYPSLLQRIVVEGVQRLPHLHHHVVRHVHHVVHRGDPDGDKPPAQPFRRRPHLYARNDPRRVARAKVPVDYLDARPIAHVLPQALAAEFGHLEFQLQQRRNVPGNPYVIKRIRPAIQRLDLVADVVPDPLHRLDHVAEAR